MREVSKIVREVSKSWREVSKIRRQDFSTLALP